MDHPTTAVLLLAALMLLNSRTARSEEDRDTLWDAWGAWSECSRSCGGGASYSLRRCLSSKTCEGQNIKYRTCSNVDCPLDSGDFRAQQCSAHADVRFQGRYHEWLPVDNDPENPCALKCKAKGSDLVVELAPKVLDGTRCYTESFDMCISGACQIVGCDHELGSTAKEDNCGVCNGDSSSCRLVRGHYKSQQASGKAEDTVIVIPYGSRHVRLVLKGPNHLYLESKTLLGIKGELSLERTKQYILENTTIDFQRLTEKAVLRIVGPLQADFTVTVYHASGTDSVAQFIFYQPIVHRWRETDFFPCSVSCGGGYQLTSSECFDLRSNRVVVDQYCHYYPENVKPKPRLQECNMDPCPDSDGYKQIMPYDLYHPLPRWESSPWTACSTSCGGGIQSRSVSCVEEDMQGNITPTDEWKCLYASKSSIVQPCNNFDCPTWITQEWSPCTVTCGQGLRYRVVLCIDHRGLHAGGCNPTTKPHIKEDCLVPVPCYKPVEKVPVEAKPPWFKQAIELEEDMPVSEEPMFIRGAWGPCSRTCGAGTQRRTVKCQVLLSFSQTVADLPDDECEGQKPTEIQPCYRTPCPGVRADHERERVSSTTEREELHDWEYNGFTECSKTCGGGMKEVVVICLNKQTGEAADESECVSAQRPPELIQACSTEACPPRWEVEAWSACSATCGVGLQTRAVSCLQKGSEHSNYTEKVKDEMCRQPKPFSVQACNRFDCPPMWYARKWSQCSHTCGGGSQKREVFCKQRMADGSVLDLPETFCHSPSLPMIQPCGQTDCPAQWVFSDWTQCSATCGEGTQRLLVVCRRLGKTGQYRTLIPEACTDVPKPSTARSCSVGPCEKNSKPVAAKLDPVILSQRKVYIQWKKSPKLQFVVGGFAYLLPWTSIVLRCPTRHYRKGFVRWLKDGKPLVFLPHVSISHLGYLKIQQVRASDIGMYTCVAGQMQENFVLKLIGSKQKGPIPEQDFWVTGGGKFSTKTEISTTSKDKAKEITFNRYDAVVQCLLGLKGLSIETYFSNELLEEDSISDSQTPQVLVADMQKLDEVTRNLSDGLHVLQKHDLITQLLEELIRNSLQNNESTLEPHEKPDFMAQRTERRPTYQSNKPSAEHFLGSPVIIRKLSILYKSSKDIVTQSGSLVLLPKQAIRVELQCEAHGNPQPLMIWTKEGMELKNSSRVGLMQDGSLYIEGPRDTDSGIYTCQATNNLGSTSRSFQVKNAGIRCKNSHAACNRSAYSQNQQSTNSCHGQHCRQRWQVSSWSSCSVSCGSGIQTRNVTCVGVTDEGMNCIAGPLETRACNTQPCTSWMTTLWSPCHGKCVGSGQALQKRNVFCQDKNGTRVAQRFCSSQPRPTSHQNCTTEACALQWRIGPWKQCTATCGRHGFQSRHVACVHQSTGKPAQEFHCAWRPRPASWQRCNIRPCGKGECRDSSRYCEKVRQLELCSLPQFKARCCRSCRDT